MATAAQISLFAMNQKGLAVVEACARELKPDSIACVVGARDSNVRRDFYAEIQEACQSHGIRFLDRSEAVEVPTKYAFAIGWRWMIRGCKNLIVLHDSLLPRYRGFAPLPAALINGDEVVGVTALVASEEYDRGDIIAQKRVSLTYPVKIQRAIDSLTGPYAELAVEIAQSVLAGLPLTARPQDESRASYSPWRDDDDYRIDWSLDATAIRRFIDALGPPYKGAASELDGVLIRILDASIEPDVRIEQRVPGKVMFVRDDLPIVACGTGMLKLADVRNDAGTHSILPLHKFRSRFR